MHWLAGGTVPEDDRFPLIGNPQGRYSIATYRIEDFLKGSRLGLPDLERIMLYPSWFRIMLGQFPLGDGYDAAVAIKGQCARARGALVEGKDKVLGQLPISSRSGP